MAPLPARTPIVVFGDDWGRHVSTMQHLFRQLNDRHPVIWVNAIGHRPPSLSIADAKRVVQKVRTIVAGRRGSAAAAEPGFEAGTAPLEVIHPRVLPWHQYAAARAVNRRWLLGAIRGALGKHGLTERPVLVTGTPPSVCILGHLGERGSIYLCMDDFLHLPSASASMIGPLERELLGRIDATVATARALVESKRPRSGRSHYLPQGVNFEHFSAPRPVPADLAKLPRPIIGFAGGLATSVDFPLVAKLAERFPAASIALVGPASVDLSLLRAPNIHILGARPYAELPAYVQAFDVATIPYVLNSHTIAVDPLKLLEYLAAGVPVVTTDLPEVRKYAHAVTVAGDHETFVAGVRAALASRGTREGHQTTARAHTWEARAMELERIIFEVAAIERR